MEKRIGLGEDLHCYEKGIPLIIAGVKVPYEKGLAGHSDGDIVFHAVSDAILSALGLRDIGYYFPPSEESIKGIDSRKILEFAKSKIDEEGYSIENLALVIHAQEPKLSPYIDAFKESLTQTLKIETKRIGITCKTGEGLGPIGLKEAASCRAIILLEE